MVVGNNVPPLAGLSTWREAGRKAFHVALLVIPLWYVLVPSPWGPLGLIIATFGVVTLDILRLRNRTVGRWFRGVFGRLIRPSEERSFLGSTYYAVAAFLSLLVFDRMIAVTALAFLVFGDAVAAVVGTSIGRPVLRGKSLEGSLACFICCLIIAFALLDAGWVIIAGATAATAAEALPLPLNDNFRMPILGGLAMHVVMLSTQR